MRNRNAPTLVFLTTAVVLIGSMMYAYRTGTVRIQNTQKMTALLEAVDQISTTLSHLKDAETGERGFIITGDEQYLEPYLRGNEFLIHDMEALQRLEKAGRIESADFARLQSLIASRLEIFKRGIEARRSAGVEAAAAIVRTGQGRLTMDTIRALIASMTERVNRKLTDARDLNTELSASRSTVILGVIAVNLLFLVWAYSKIRTEINAREAAAAEVWRQKELVSVTLSSIGDGVIVTDVQARIIFMNVIAETLTGWTFEQAVNRPCGEIFRIINESSRQPVENPVDKVIRQGTIVGLANHTLLIRPDGSELAIDDSGAPVRARDGTLLGAVLVFRDFSDHKASEKKLIEARDGLESANRAKDRFLATLSHELRTPLTPVLATLTAWESNFTIPGSLHDDVVMLRRNLELEARLIDDLLDLNRIIKGKLHLESEVVDLHELIAAVTSIHGNELKDKHIECAMSLRADRHFVRADPARLQQVLWNVFKNATKFTPSGGRIQVETQNDPDGKVVTKITDTGSGMTRDLIGRLFLPFEQGDDESVRRAGGLGLGMAIAKSLIDMQNGTIRADSDGPGKGSTFTISLPSVDGPAHHAEQTSMSNSIGGTETEKPLRILIVEDHEDTATVMSRLLTRLGHQVQTIGTVAGAVEMVRANDFDVVLSDIGLPDASGVDFIKQVRAFSHVPAVALSGFGMDDDVAEAQAAGFNAHVTKPVNFNKLQSVLRDVTRPPSA